LAELMSTPEKSQRVFQAIMQMEKLEIDKLVKA
jgi:predicted 3-demethylubiquinone-9 3-methyltransferase (glyoxalase superfamily)